MRHIWLGMLLALCLLASAPATSHADEALFSSVVDDIREAERIGGLKARDSKLAQIMRAARLAYTDLQIVELVAYLLKSGFSESLLATEAAEAGINAEILTLAHKVAFEGFDIQSINIHPYDRIGSIYVFSDSAHVAGARECTYVSPWRWSCF